MSQVKAPLPPFSVKFSPQLPELMSQLQLSIAITTYQAGKVLFLNPKNNEQLQLVRRNFQKPMGMAMEGDKLAVACKEDLVVLRNSPDLAAHYIMKPGFYDALFMPRATYYTGTVDIHDIEWGKDGELWGVNTSFSCLCTIDDNYSFEPKWQPSFISELVHEDRCHLNGLVLKNGVPKYVTALGKSNTRSGWRDNIVEGGILIDVESNEIICDGLAMPHSPCLHNGKLYMVLSASGEFVEIDLKTKKKIVIKDLGGFCRGLSIEGDYAFIGMSKLRKNSSTFAKLSFAEKANFSGVKVVHIPTKSIVGEVEFLTSVEEIYDVKVLSGMRMPSIMNAQKEVHSKALHLPNATYWSKGE